MDTILYKMSKNGHFQKIGCPNVQNIFPFRIKRKFIGKNWVSTSVHLVSTSYVKSWKYKFYKMAFLSYLLLYIYNIYIYIYIYRHFRKIEHPPKKFKNEKTKQTLFFFSKETPTPPGESVQNHHY